MIDIAEVRLFLENYTGVYISGEIYTPLDILTGSFFFIFSPMALLAMFFSLFQLSASNLKTGDR